LEEDRVILNIGTHHATTDPNVWDMSFDYQYRGLFFQTPINMTETFASQVDIQYVKRGTHSVGAEAFNLTEYVGTTNMTARIRGANQIIVDFSQLTDFEGDILYVGNETWQLTQIIEIIFAVCLLIMLVVCFCLGPKKKVVVSMEQPKIGQVRFRSRSERQRASIADRQATIQLHESLASSDSQDLKQRRCCSKRLCCENIRLKVGLRNTLALITYWKWKLIPLLHLVGQILKVWYLTKVSFAAESYFWSTFGAIVFPFFLVVASSIRDL
jgi:hypothetical protein